MEKLLLILSCAALVSVAHARQDYTVPAEVLGQEFTKYFTYVGGTCAQVADALAGNDLTKEFGDIYDNNKESRGSAYAAFVCMAHLNCLTSGLAKDLYGQYEKKFYDKVKSDPDLDGLVRCYYTESIKCKK